MVDQIQSEIIPNMDTKLGFVLPIYFCGYVSNEILIVLDLRIKKRKEKRCCSVHLLIPKQDIKVGEARAPGFSFPAT